jgi:hypothetical protein
MSPCIIDQWPPKEFNSVFGTKRGKRLIFKVFFLFFYFQNLFLIVYQNNSKKFKYKFKIKKFKFFRNTATIISNKL